MNEAYKIDVYFGGTMKAEATVRGNSLNSMLAIAYALRKGGFRADVTWRDGSPVHTAAGIVLRECGSHAADPRDPRKCHFCGTSIDAMRPD